MRIFDRKSFARRTSGSVKNCLGRRLFDDLAVGHEDDAVGGLAGEAHLVGDDDHRHAVFGEPHHDVEHLGDHLGVERARRLVEQHHLRVHRERPGDGDALLLTARELGRHLVGLVGDADPVEQLHRRASRPRPSSCLRTLIGPSVTFSRIVLWAKRLNDWNTMPTSARKRRERRALLGQTRAVDRDACRVDRLEPVDRPAERRLARAARADHDDDLAAVDGRGDVLQDVQFAEVLVDVVEDDQGFHALHTNSTPAIEGQTHSRFVTQPKRDSTVTRTALSVALGERALVEAHRCGGRQVHRLGMAVDRHRDRPSRRARVLVGEPARLVAEQPCRRRGEHAVRAGGEQVVALDVGGEHLQARLACTRSTTLASSPPTATGTWKSEPVVERTTLGL